MSDSSYPTIIDEVREVLNKYCETQTCHDCGLAHEFMELCLKNNIEDILYMFINSSPTTKTEDDNDA